MNRILVAGAPRSGTTWLADVLAATPGSRLEHEPDNTHFHPEATPAMELYGGYAVAHRAEAMPAYEELWDAAFRDQPPDSAVIVKTVLGVFSLDWIVDRYDPRVVIIQRHPVRVIDSWMRLGFMAGDLAWRDRVRAEHVEARGLPAWDPRWDPWAKRLVEVSWAVGLLMTAVRVAARAHPEWTVVSHEWLSTYPAGRVASLAEALGLEWSDHAAAHLRTLGMSDTVDVAAGAYGIPLAWRDYPAADAVEAMVLLRRFPELTPWLGEPANGASTVSLHAPPSSTTPSRASSSATRNSSTSSR